MNVVFGAVVGAILSVLFGLIFDILLPENVRIKIKLLKSKLYKWIRNPSYVVGFSSRCDLKQKIELERFRSSLRDIFSSKYPTKEMDKGYSEVHYSIDAGFDYEIHISLKPGYEEDEEDKSFYVYYVHVLVKSKVKYRDIQNHILDLMHVLHEVEIEITRKFSAEILPKRQLYIETNHAEEFFASLTYLKVQKVIGVFKDMNIKITYIKYDKDKLTMEGAIDSQLIKRLKDIMAYFSR